MDITKQNDFQSIFQYSQWRIKPEINIGQFNFDTPICYMLKNYYGSDLSNYICHNEASSDSNETIYVFIMINDLLLTKWYSLEAEPSTSPNPIISIIDYKKVIKHLYIMQ